MSSPATANSCGGTVFPLYQPDKYKQIALRAKPKIANKDYYYMWHCRIFELMLKAISHMKKNKHFEAVQTAHR